MAISPEAYKQIAQLNVFPESALADLAAGALERNVVRRELILNKGDVLPFFPFLIEGRLQGIDFTLDGREVGLYFVGPGEFFGELAVIDRLPVAETVIAIAPSRLVLFPKEQTRALMFSSPEMSEAVTRRLAGRLRAVAGQRLLLALPSPMQRMCAQLLELAQDPGATEQAGVVAIPSAPTHQEIAIMINSSRETITRAFQQLQNQEVIRRDRSHLLILDIEQLKQLAWGAN
ncbi:MAG: Crp/Fnr family transcriptional regulator [Zoogloea oleivorans]|jgi:CRP-like cAMP-binding protein|uniref:Crp/Fnr family transcriptional regulator n=1 Tax=Zoogloea oleivorans TaxID=1552750 RepID=UPI002A358F16|nr:Crp/Fnr family transcriptional regulator [Zoogloea oleivorans]MDY0036827.1 Crp/Fnr family transcriptional regulator [Zoogloea oleivorans]